MQHAIHNQPYNVTRKKFGTNKMHATINTINARINCPTLQWNANLTGLKKAPACCKVMVHWFICMAASQNTADKDCEDHGPPGLNGSPGPPH